MRKLISSALIAFSLYLPASAYAQTSSSAAQGGFTGVRIEAALGYDELGNSSPYYDLPQQLDGVTVRGTAGYDIEVAPRIIAGFELGGGVTRGSRQTRSLAGDRVEMRLGVDFDAAARLGYRATSRTLIYGKAGLARSVLKSRYLAEVGATHDVSSRSHHIEGFRYGIGVEQLLASGSYAKLEYRRTSYGKVGGYFPNPDRNQILLGIGLRFHAAR